MPGGCIMNHYETKAIVLSVFLLALASSLAATGLQPVRALGSGDGKILFLSHNDPYHEQIHVINADGTGEKALTNDGYQHFYPSWSPDGTEILFQRTKEEPTGRFRSADYTPGPYGALGQGIFIMNADGSDLRRIIDRPVLAPTWSPDGTRVAFPSDGGVSVVNSDGSGKASLAVDSPGVREFAWSRDGTQIAFVREQDSVEDIYVVNSDGTGLHALTKAPRDYLRILWLGIDWSPDGSEVAFVAAPNLLDADIYTVSADGSGQRRITDLQTAIGYLEWSPNGSGIAFASPDGLMLISADGGEPRRLSEHFPVASSLSWSPDGSQIVSSSLAGIIAISADGSGERVLTPDQGRWVDWQPEPGLQLGSGGGDNSWFIWIAGGALAVIVVGATLSYLRLRKPQP